MSGSPKEFHIEEFKALKEEIRLLVASAEQLLQYAVIVCAAVYTWLVTKDPKVAVVENADCSSGSSYTQALGYAWWIPFIVSVVIGVVGVAKYWRVKQTGQYLKTLEHELGIKNLGWESYLKDCFPILAVVGTISWLSIIVVTALIGFEFGKL